MVTPKAGPPTVASRGARRQKPTAPLGEPDGRCMFACVRRPKVRSTVLGRGHPPAARPTPPHAGRIPQLSFSDPHAGQRGSMVRTRAFGALGGCSGAVGACSADTSRIRPGMHPLRAGCVHEGSRASPPREEAFGALCCISHAASRQIVCHGPRARLTSIFRDDHTKPPLRFASRPTRSPAGCWASRIGPPPGWTCGNAMLDPAWSTSLQLHWLTADGRISAWVRVVPPSSMPQDLPC